MAFGQSKEKTTGQKVYEGFKKVRELSAKEKPKPKTTEDDDSEVVYDPEKKYYTRKKKKTVEPTKGFMQRMMDKYIYGKKDGS